MTLNLSSRPFRSAMLAAAISMLSLAFGPAHAQTVASQKIDWAGEPAIRDYRAVDERTCASNEATALNASDNVAVMIQAVTGRPAPTTVIARR